MPRSRGQDSVEAPAVFTTGQAAAALGVRSVNTVKRWVSEGTLEGFRRGSRVLVLKDSVARLQKADEGRTGRVPGGVARVKTGGAQKLDVLSELLNLPTSALPASRARMLASTAREIRRRVSPLLKSHGISKAFLFGSAVRGDVRVRSDIDIAVEIPSDSSMDLVAFVGLALDLEAVLGRKVDLVNLATMKPRIRERVEGEQVSLL